MSTTEPTVTACLAELRELFPDAAVSVQFSEDGHRQWCYLRRRNKIVATGPTLSEAMSQARAWKKEQQ